MIRINYKEDALKYTSEYIFFIKIKERSLTWAKREKCVENIFNSFIFTILGTVFLYACYFVMLILTVDVCKKKHIFKLFWIIQLAFGLFAYHSIILFFYFETLRWVSRNIYHIFVWIIWIFDVRDRFSGSATLPYVWK